LFLGRRTNRNLFLIDKNQAKQPSFKSFTDRFKDIPKIVFQMSILSGILRLDKKRLNLSCCRPFFKRAGFSYQEGAKEKES